MRERPILMSSPMVRAILEGRKSQTRRVVKPQPRDDTTGFLTGIEHEVVHHWPINGGDYTGSGVRCPYGVPGDRLWCKETWSKAKSCNCSDIFYRADGEVSGKQTALSYIERERTWRPSIFMPRWASRITLEVTDVRVERLQAISDADVIAEGIGYDADGYCWSDESAPSRGQPLTINPIDAYRWLWESINGAGSWDANPWVWVVSFRRIEA